jgi:hypothetical protein
LALIYALASSSEPDVIRYIGRTKYTSPEKRLDTHKGHMKYGRKTHVYNWMRKVYSSGNSVVCICIESNLSWQESANREVYWIKFYKEKGYDLTNISNGGDGSLSVSQETKDLMSKNRKGKSPSPQCHDAARHANIGRVKTQEERAKLSAAHTGKIYTQETKDRISKAKKGTIISEETRQKISRSHKLRLASSLEARERLANIGRAAAAKIKEKNAAKRKKERCYYE